MSQNKISVDQYGRKKWDVDAYEKEAKQGKRDPLTDLAAARRAAASVDDYVSHRADLLQQSVLSVQQHTLVSAERSQSGVRGKSKRFGFFCPVCDLSFRDTLALVDHINSPQHTQNARKLAGNHEGAVVDSLGFSHSSYDEVLLTIERLVKLLLQTRAKTALFQERVRKREAFEKLKAEKRRNRKKRRRLESELESELQLVMGLRSFGKKN